MSDGYINLPETTVGITSINGDSTPAQDIVGSTDISVNTVDGITTITYTGMSGGVSSVGATAPVMSSGGGTPVISITQATSLTNGYLSSTDWNTFNSKQTAGNYLTALTSDVTASGPGSASATIAAIQGTTVSGTTGTGDVVFSTSPTFTTKITVPLIEGGATSNGNLLLSSTSNATKGFVGPIDTSILAAGSNVVAGLAAYTTAGDYPPAQLYISNLDSDSTAQDNSVLIEVWGGTGANALALGSTGGTGSAPAYLTNGTHVFTIYYTGWNGSTPNDQNLGTVGAVATENHTSSAFGTSINITSTANGTTNDVITASFHGAVVTLGPSGGTGQHILNTSTAAAASGVGTFTNLPAGYSGNPTGYVQVTINGGTHVIPYW